MKPLFSRAEYNDFEEMRLLHEEKFLKFFFVKCKHIYNVRIILNLNSDHTKKLITIFEKRTIIFHR